MTGLPVIALKPGDGWCDDPREPFYNRLVPLPCPGSHERLWREDGAASGFSIGASTTNHRIKLSLALDLTKDTIISVQNTTSGS